MMNTQGCTRSKTYILDIEVIVLLDAYQVLQLWEV